MKRPTRDDVLLWSTVLLWGPALLVGLICGVIMVGFIAGIRYVVEDAAKK